MPYQPLAPPIVPEDFCAPLAIGKRRDDIGEWRDVSDLSRNSN
jgi:hypothetical protein